MQEFSVSKTAPVNFFIKRGDTFLFTFQVQENGIGVNLSDFNAAKMQVRESELSSPVLTYSSSANTISIANLSSGLITISGSTSSVVANNYYYDLQLSNNNITQTILSGTLTVENDFTL